MDNAQIRRLTRAWLMQRRAQPAPLPSLEQIRRAVGWRDGAPQQEGAQEPYMAGLPAAAMPGAGTAYGSAYGGAGAIDDCAAHARACPLHA